MRQMRVSEHNRHMEITDMSVFKGTSDLGIFRKGLPAVID